MKHVYCRKGKLCLYICSLLFIFALLWAWKPVRAQQSLTFQGRVLSASDREPLPGASVQLRGTHHGTVSDENGYFTFTVTGSSVALRISFIGYVSLDTVFSLPLKRELVVALHPDSNVLEGVTVSTGYWESSRAQTTGALTHLDNSLLNRRVSTNFLERLDGVAPGVYSTGLKYGAPSVNPTARSLGIRVRGESTLANSSQVSRDPLIILDNFPFEGSIEHINPNDIASITILKDAASTAIWGARAGNGVVVITTKKGSTGQRPSVELNMNWTVGGKPDLNYDQNYLDATRYIEIERELFANRYFDSDLNNQSNRPPLSPVVELLDHHRKGLLSDQELASHLSGLENRDIRRDFSKHVYQKSVNQQYSLGISGGTTAMTYRFSAGYDQNQTNVKGNDYNRITLQSQNSFRPMKGLELRVGLNYSSSRTVENNYQNHYGSLRVGGKYGDLYPYARLADEEGNPLAVTKDYRTAYLTHKASEGFLDWHYRPLEEVTLADNATRNQNLLLKTALSYRITPSLRLEASYQAERQFSKLRNYRPEQTYYVRNLINRYSVQGPDGTFSYPFPRGGILEVNDIDHASHSLRGTLHYNQLWAGKHAVSFLAGMETNELNTTGYRRLSYGYDEQTGRAISNLDFSRSHPVHPAGVALLPSMDGSVSGVSNRFLSYYANAAYTLAEKYNVSVTGRRDGANIFGARINERVTPLWSVGLGWTLSREEFYRVSWLPYLRFRAARGTSGNPYQGSVYVTGTYFNSDLTGFPTILNLTAPNPRLKWETVATTNLGADLRLLGERISASIDVYWKRGTDLIQNQPTAPSSGFNFYYRNSAGTLTRGVDLQLDSKNLSGAFQWNTTLFASVIKDKIERFEMTMGPSSIQNSTVGRMGVVGRPLYALYSYAWKGLDDSGNPQGLLNREPSTDYTGIINNFNPDSLVYHGPTIPAFHGSLMNHFGWKGFSLSMNITFKTGYYFRRPSVGLNYADVLAGQAHQDYDLRWQSPGDELTTPIPGLVYPSNSARNTFYQFSEVLVERGDHVRLRDVRFSYSFSESLSRKWGFAHSEVYLFANNPGMIWRANNKGLDPDFTSTASRHLLPIPPSFSIGFKLSL